MNIRIDKRIGNATVTFEISEDKTIDALAKASQFTTIPERCTLCQSTDLVLDSNKADSFVFVKIKCLKCNGRSQMGQFKDGSGIFWKPFEKYVPPVKKEGQV